MRRPARVNCASSRLEAGSAYAGLARSLHSTFARRCVRRHHDEPGTILSLSLSLVVSIGCASTPARRPSRRRRPRPAPATAQAPTCSAGDVLFEGLATTDIAAGPEKGVVFGGMALDRSGGGTATGCLNAGDLATIQRDVASPWTTSPRSGAGVHGHMAHSPTTFYANGQGGVRRFRLLEPGARRHQQPRARRIRPSSRSPR